MSFSPWNSIGNKTHLNKGEVQNPSRLMTDVTPSAESILRQLLRPQFLNRDYSRVLVSRAGECWARLPFGFPHSVLFTTVRNKIPIKKGTCQQRLAVLISPNAFQQHVRGIVTAGECLPKPPVTRLSPLGCPRGKESTHGPENPQPTPTLEAKATNKCGQKSCR